ncbi:MAG: L-threonylcarbamoyladenylate synthase [Treponemataceae bacterium]|nr:L-threonylcarbamoyladenylate synthase [Treponemataceae bacterium]
MKYLKSEAISSEATVEALKNQKIVIIPTDTVYGFSGITGSGDTDGIIRRIKGREAYKPFIQLIPDPEFIFRITDDKVPEELFSLWPGALTIIVNDKRSSSGGSVAVRCPGDSWLRDIIHRVGAPIYSTSVNRSGKKVLSEIAEIEYEFGNDVELIIDDGDKKNALPSTIVSVSRGGCEIIRQGSVIVPESIRRVVS